MNSQTFGHRLFCREEMNLPTFGHRLFYFEKTTQNLIAVRNIKLSINTYKSVNLLAEEAVLFSGEFLDSEKLET